MTLAEAEQKYEGMVAPEFIAQREGYYQVVPEGQTVIGSCSDEREETPESSSLIAQTYPEALSTRQGMLRVFGGPIGLAMAAITSSIAAGKRLPETMDSIPKMMATIDARMEGAQLIALNHSDAAQEENPTHLKTSGESPMGCAFANLAGATADLLVNNEVIQAEAHRQQAALFGPNNHTDVLLAAEAELLETATQGLGGSYAVSRRDYAASHRPTVVLAGKPHAPIAKTGIIFNATDELASPSAANGSQLDFYSVDLKQATRKLMAILPELELDPQLVFESLALQAVPVRAALELGDSEHKGSEADLNPTRLGVGVRGSLQQAIADLQTA